MNAAGRALAALGIGIVAVGHWFWVSGTHGIVPRVRLLAMDSAVELYAGIFLIGVGVHALATWYWFSDPNPPTPSSVREQ
ncbi:MULTISPECIES: hypothetical protein [Bradyrhizobium]|jgi:hypothetical protein|uniref:hypothetical protein n=1 Tax=Bradyrhizobium TaxID=374 RepID=UPI00046445B9|nr:MULTISPECIES: hypothetical protein [Bradyrhizobium]AUC99466.1 hypothetical protein CWS35_08715 [Bradyrhizobium sp. SK17]KIU48956.1 hypothetical protein QU41_13515 [Bradyrhizobium elkanii]MBK5656707.1 hypothetical protein [Rhizobium sp.]OCX29419.1 hypothetical protein QU42_19960 [Bradyrhizobium sp. UASWS1016]